MCVLVVHSNGVWKVWKLGEYGRKVCWPCPQFFCVHGRQERKAHLCKLRKDRAPGRNRRSVSERGGRNGLAEHTSDWLRGGVRALARRELQARTPSERCSERSDANRLLAVGFPFGPTMRLTVFAWAAWAASLDESVDFRRAYSSREAVLARRPRRRRRSAFDRERSTPPGKASDRPVSRGLGRFPEVPRSRHFRIPFVLSFAASCFPSLDREQDVVLLALIRSAGGI